MPKSPSAVAPPLSRAQKARTDAINWSGATKTTMMTASSGAWVCTIQPSSSAVNRNDPMAKAKNPIGRGLASGAA